MEQLIGVVVGAVIVFAFASIFGFSAWGRSFVADVFWVFRISGLFRISRDVTFFEVLFSLTDLNLILDENCVL